MGACVRWLVLVLGLVVAWCALVLGDCLLEWQVFVRFRQLCRTMVVEVVTMAQEALSGLVEVVVDPFSAEMEARVCELVVGDRRHGLVVG